jgi:predicted CopG family antitoxin
MPRRTTLVLDDKVYEKLVRESVNRYGTARNLSRVVNDLVHEKAKRVNIRDLIFSEKMPRTSAKEFEEFRRKMSARLERQSWVLPTSSPWLGWALTLTFSAPFWKTRRRSE